MPAAKCRPVTGTQGNVIFCDFGPGSAAALRGEGSLEEMLAGIRAGIAEINCVVSETLAAHTEASVLEREAAQLLLQALDSMDIVAFQSRILLAGADNGRSGDAGVMAASLRHFVAAGVAVGQRLHALATERRSWVGAEERVLQDIAANARQLEATAGDCIRATRGDPLFTDAPL